MFSTQLINLFTTLLLLTPSITALSTPQSSAIRRSSIPEEYRNQARDLVRFPIKSQGEGAKEAEVEVEVEVLRRHFKRSGVKGKRGLKGKRACSAAGGVATSTTGASAASSTMASSSTIGSSTTMMTTAEESKTVESMVITATSLPVVNAPVISTTTTSTSAAASSTSTSAAAASPTTKTSTSAAPAATSSTFKSPDYEGNGPFDGESTYYVLGTDGNAVGACGTNLVDSDLIAAASEYLFDSWPGANGNPNQNPICGQFAKVSYQGKSVVVRIADRCPGCEKRHLDLSPSAFSQLASFDVGLMDVTWEWVATASG